MKPANIMMKKDGGVKLIDFGIAREYKKGAKSDTTYIGTRGFAAPEQFGTAQSDARTDIYSLGVTLYNLITGKGPNDYPYEIIPVRKLNKKLSRGIEHVINKCTRQNPKERYQSVEALLKDLNNIDKFDIEYKRKQLKRDIKAISFILSIAFFSYLTYAGFLQISKEKIEDYNATIQTGTQLLSGRNYDGAIRSFKEAMVKMPKKTESYRGIAQVYLNQGDYEKCIDYIVNEVLLNVEEAYNDSDVFYILGTAYFNMEDYKKAAMYFESAAKINPVKVEYLRDLAVSQARSGDLNRAKAALGDIEGMSIAEEVTYYVKGEILCADNKINEGIESFEKSLAAAKNEEVKEKAFLSEAEAYKRLGNSAPDLITKEIDVLLRAENELKEKNNLIVTEMLGEAYYQRALKLPQSSNRNEDLTKSAKCFEALLNSGYGRAYIHRNIAIIYQQLGDFKKSEDVLLNMKKLYPDDYRPYLQLALLYAEMEGIKANELRNYDKTYENYKLAVKYSPQGEKNPDLQPLVNLIGELKDKKWIK
jgi:serine/threonine-protein kinase